MAAWRRKREYVVERLDQLEALVSPLRVRIVDVAAQLGECSIAEIAAAIDRRPSTLYRHAAALESAGLLERVGTRKATKHEEAVYRTPAAVIRLSDAVGTSRQRATLARLYSAMLRRLDRGLRAWVLSKDNARRGRFRRAFLVQTTGWLTPAERDRADALAGELLDLALHGERRRRSAATEAELEQTTLTVAIVPERSRD